jgi:hypothetical protein
MGYGTIPTDLCGAGSSRVRSLLKPELLLI